MDLFSTYNQAEFMRVKQLVQCYSELLLHFYSHYLPISLLTKTEQMNVKDLHQDTKVISTTSLFKTTEGNVTSIQILANQQLKDHITKVPAMLLCLTGEADFENENGLKITLTTGEYVNIEPNVKHWVNAKSTSNLILIK